MDGRGTIVPLREHAGCFYLWLCIRLHNRAEGQPVSPRCLTLVKAYCWTPKILYKTVEDHNTKTDIVVPVVRVVVVADRDTRVVFIVVPRAAPKTL